ncbi:MAG: ribonuclease M5 [Anaerorhabdus sp.]
MVIKEVIVVEGRHDSAVLKSYFNCDTIETGGSHLSLKTLKLIEEVQKSRGVIIFCDPDVVGEKIRSIINNKISGCKNAFIEKSKAKTSKKVGVEHASKADLLEALKNCITYNDSVSSDLNLSDLYDLGLSGMCDSEYKRDVISSRLHLGKGSAKTFLKRCRMLNLSKSDLEKEVNK